MSTITDKKNLPWIDEEYRKALKELRRFYTGYQSVNGYDLRSSNLKVSLTNYQKRKIRQQFRYIDHLQSGVPKRIYRARSKKNIDTILKAQGFKAIPRNLKVALVPDIAGTKTTIRHVKSRKITAIDSTTKKKITLIELAPVESITMGVIRRYINIQRDFFEQETEEAIKESIRLTKADFYTIQAGFHEIQKDEYKIKFDDTPEEITRKVKKLQLRYNKEEDNNHWHNWLGGIIAYHYPPQLSKRAAQAQFEHYRVITSIERKKHFTERKNKHKRNFGRKKRIQELAQNIRFLLKMREKYKKTRQGQITMYNTITDSINKYRNQIIKIKQKILKDS